MNKEKKTVTFYGMHPLRECFLALERGGISDKATVLKVSITKEARERPEVMGLLQKNKIIPSVVTIDEVEHLAGKGTVHQGIVVQVSHSFLYADFDEIISDKQGGERELIVLLDELEDPHNVGAIIRSAACFGATAILIPEHGQVDVTSTVVKTSSGMNFVIPIAKVGNVNTVLEKLKKKHYWVYGLASEGTAKLSDTSFDQKTVLVIGAEGKGIREKTLALCDFAISIPISPVCESLNASVATAIAMYEWNKQGGE